MVYDRIKATPGLTLKGKKTVVDVFPNGTTTEIVMIVGDRKVLRAYPESAASLGLNLVGQGGIAMPARTSGGRSIEVRDDAAGRAVLVDQRNVAAFNVENARIVGENLLEAAGYGDNRPTAIEDSIPTAAELLAAPYPLIDRNEESIYDESPETEHATPYDPDELPPGYFPRNEVGDLVNSTGELISIQPDLEAFRDGLTLALGKVRDILVHSGEQIHSAIRDVEEALSNAER